MNLAIFALTKNGIKLAKNLSQKIGGAVLFTSPEDFKKSVRYAFKKHDGLIFIMALGIVVRIISPLLKNKAKDPAVVVMDEKRKNVISLISGHLGGANAIAKKVAKKIGARPVITTATDVNNLPCIEDIANRFNLVIEDVKKIKLVNSAIVNGKKVAFIDENAKRLGAIKNEVESRKREVNFKFYKSISGIQNGDVFVIITNNFFPRIPHLASHMLLRPKDLVVGIGCDRGVTAKEVEDAYFNALKQFNLSPLSVRNLASIDIKKNEKGLLRFAKKHGLKIDFYSKDKLAEMPLPSGFSRFVMEKVGVGGVCEPAALKSAGVKRYAKPCPEFSSWVGSTSLRSRFASAKILVKKQKIGRVTIAVAGVAFNII